MRRLHLLDRTLLEDLLGLHQSVVDRFRIRLRQLFPVVVDELFSRIDEPIELVPNIDLLTPFLVLAGMGLQPKPVVTALNKVDLVEQGISDADLGSAGERLNLTRSDFVLVSAATGVGIPTLLERIAAALGRADAAAAV